MEEPNRRTTTDDSTDANSPPPDRSRTTSAGDDVEAREGDETLSIGRRLFLGATGAATLGSVSSIGAVAAGDDENGGASGWVIEQGDNCVPLDPIEDDLSAAQFYEWDEGATDYSSQGTTDLQEAETSLLFLYRAANGELYLVVVHEQLTDENDDLDGGSATFEFQGLPDDGSWVVQDDFYDAPTNFDNWDVDQDPQVVDWTWAAGRTDGGVYGPLGDVSEFTIVPQFNDQAALYGVHYEGNVDEWVALSGDRSDPESASLDMNSAVTIRRGTCETDGTPAKPDEPTKEPDKPTKEPDDSASPLQVTASCSVQNPATVEITNAGDQTVEVRDMDDDGDNLIDGRPTVDAGETMTLTDVPDGEYVVQAFVPGTESEEIGSSISFTVSCPTPLKVEVLCNVSDPATVRITNQSGYTVEVRDIDDSGGDLLDGRPPLDTGDSMELTGVPNGEYVVQAFVPGTEKNAVGPRTTITVDC